MKKIGLIFGLAICLFTVPGSWALELPIGLAFDTPETLDLTYQVVPVYDEEEKVIAGWDGETLQYFISTNKLPPGYLNAKFYLSGMTRDLDAAWGGVKTGKKTSYKTTGGLRGTAVVYTQKSKDKSSLVVHFLEDGKQSFMATAGAFPPATIELALENSITLFKTAKVTEATGDIQRSEDELVGIWVSEAKLPDGRLIVATTELKPDLSFATNIRSGDKTLFLATGAWSRNGNNFHWQYLYSQPVLPEDKREDEDKILNIQADTLELQSSLTGERRIFKRAASNP